MNYRPEIEIAQRPNIVHAATVAVGTGGATLIDTRTHMVSCQKIRIQKVVGTNTVSIRFNGTAESEGATTFVLDGTDVIDLDGLDFAGTIHMDAEANSQAVSILIWGRN